MDLADAGGETCFEAEGFGCTFLWFSPFNDALGGFCIPADGLLEASFLIEPARTARLPVASEGWLASASVASGACLLALAVVGLIILAMKPSEGVAEVLVLAFTGPPRGSVFLLVAAVDEVNEARGFALPLTPLAGPRLARGARLVRVEAVFGAALGRPADCSSSCFAFDAAVGAIRCDEVSIGLREFVDRSSFLLSDSCFAEEDAVGAVRCEGRLTGTVGDRGPDFEGGDLGPDDCVDVAVLEGPVAGLLLELAVLRRFDNVFCALCELFASVGDRMLALPALDADVRGAVVVTLDGRGLVLLTVGFVEAGLDVNDVLVLSFSFGSAAVSEAFSSSTADTALSGCSLCRFRFGSVTPF